MKHVKMPVMAIVERVLASAAYLKAYAYPADYDPQYPLKGHLVELGLEFEWDNNTYADKDHDQGAHRDGLIMVDFCGHFPTDQPYTK